MKFSFKLDYKIFVTQLIIALKFSRLIIIPKKSFNLESMKIQTII
jgi:hypothetical protein